ncbi:hypothetical protein niasHT_001496 [Heterodera trifolii]|uniref:Fibronectin type-III domain-containing protein n=1 Tax=Heterodera trifolii TaxID=157864 RepID=A0ABD2MEM1_9BILA
MDKCLDRKDVLMCRELADEAKGAFEIVKQYRLDVGSTFRNAYTQNSITLSWRPPKDDGGAELSGYSIEFKGLDERDWERVPDHVTLPNYTVRNLEKTTQYQAKIQLKNLKNS